MSQPVYLSIPTMKTDDVTLKNIRQNVIEADFMRYVWLFFFVQTRENCVNNLIFAHFLQLVTHQGL